MPQPVNETVGKCPCPNAFCSATADVRQQKNHPNGKRYLYCPNCHVVRLTGQAFQDYIAANMRTDAEPGAQPQDAPQAAPVAATGETGVQPQAAPKAAQEAAPSETKQKPRGLFGWVNDALGDI